MSLDAGALERGGRQARIVNALSHPDLIHLVLIVSAFGKTDGFVVLPAVAAPAFFLAVLVAWNDRRLTRSIA